VKRVDDLPDIAGVTPGQAIGANLVFPSGFSVWLMRVIDNGQVTAGGKAATQVRGDRMLAAHRSGD
jgi:hypothetical protein